MSMDSKLMHYQIRVKGHFDRKLMEWFAPLTVTNEAQGEALLTGPIRDQAELYGVLLKLYNLNFTLLAVQPAPTAPAVGSTIQAGGNDQ
ncbi:MAG: hypothetical protein DYG89_53270 [Caldilinea sp. CFX5]|nr:hypothetical protein [Caldilinea sp. CFX5]